VYFCRRLQSLILKAHLLAVPFPPGTHLTKYRLNALPKFGQGIFDLWGDLRIDVPVKDLSLLEVSLSRREKVYVKRRGRSC